MTFPSSKKKPKKIQHTERCDNLHLVFVISDREQYMWDTSLMAKLHNIIMKLSVSIPAIDDLE